MSLATVGGVHTSVLPVKGCMCGGEGRGEGERGPIELFSSGVCGDQSLFDMKISD